MHIDNSCADTVSSQHFCSAEGLRYAQAVSDNCNVCTFLHHDTFTEFELVIRVLVDYRNSCTAETHVDRAVVIISCANHRFCFDIICRACNDHARDCSHKSEVFTALMCCTIFTYGDTAVCCTDLYVQLRITNGVTNLLVSTACSEHSESACERNFACCSKTCSDTYHVTLCDTAVNVTLREYLFEDTSLSCTGKVSIQNV